MAKIRTSMAFDELSGPLPGATIARGRTGLIARRKPVYRRSVSNDQAAGNERLKQACAVWNTFDQAQARAWDAFAAQQIRHNSVNGQAYTSTGFNTFCGLTTKFLQVHPDAPPPVNPPTEPFLGDSVVVTVASIGAGQVVLAANRPNASNVVTEILVQKLKNARTKPGNVFKSADILAFRTGRLRETLNLDAEWYEMAFRFVESTTGRQTLITRIGIVQVP